VILRGFGVFLAFCGGKSVVSLWWNAWYLWCFMWCFSAAKNMPGFSTLFFVIPVLESIVKNERHAPGAKARNGWTQLETQG
jgi:hypothetical protein